MSADPTFPALHVRPPYGWLNDPNGLCRIDGRYHVFFQYNPDGPQHANVHWGHASSDDLLYWHDEPVALAPRPGTVDGGGCWSGCVVDDAGVPTAVYTGVRRHAWESGVVLARSDRALQTWVQDDHYQVEIPDDPEITEVRDPYLFTYDGHRYAVQGAGRREGPPRVLLYRCDDLTQWEELGDLIDPDDAVAAELAPAQIWECPNVFPVDDRWVLLLSLWTFTGGTYHLSGARYLLGDLIPRAEGGLRFRAASGGVLDAGPSFYAPQVLIDEVDGRLRALLWAWCWEHPDRTAEVAAAGWAGVLSFPRELTVDGDRLIAQPADELEQLRVEQLHWSNDGRIDAAAFEIQTRGPAELRLVDPHDDGPGAVVVKADAAARILVDGSLVEVFSDGPSTTSRAYPSAGARWLLRAEASATVWRLGL